MRSPCPATYAYEYPVEGVTYVFPVQSTIARGRISSIETSAARALPGVIAVLTHENAPRIAPLDDQDLAVFQSDAVAYRGQFVAAVVAETLEIAWQAASLVAVRYEEQPHDVELAASRSDLYKPEYVPQKAAPFYAADSAQGDVEAALAAAPVSLDHTYTTPTEHHNPLEPHTTLAIWSDDGNGESVTVYDTCQGVDIRLNDIATAFGLSPERVRVIAPYVGGGFGSRGFTHPYAILAVMAARVAGRPAKFAQTRQQMFGPVGYRSPTIQRVRLGAGGDGQLTAIAHEVVAQTNALYEMTEPAAVATRTMYAAPNRRTTHRLARLDLPANSWMRAPGESPGMFALESAMDELAVACGLDPIELRVRNEPAVDPETGRPFSSRGLVACLREGAERFGWAKRDLQPRQRPAAGVPGLGLDGHRLLGVGDRRWRAEAAHTAARRVWGRGARRGVRGGRRLQREPRGAAVLDARLRRPVRRGARQRRHRRGARPAAAGRLRRRTHRQPEDRPLAVPGRHDVGAVDGPARGKRAGPALWRLRQPRLR